MGLPSCNPAASVCSTFAMGSWFIESQCIGKTATHQVGTKQDKRAFHAARKGRNAGDLLACNQDVMTRTRDQGICLERSKKHASSLIACEHIVRMKSLEHVCCLRCIRIIQKEKHKTIVTGSEYVLL